MNTLKWIAGIAVVIVGVFVLLLTAAPWGVIAPPKPDAEHIFIGSTRVTIEQARTPDARVQGLSGRSLLPQGRGMLFVFAEEGQHRIWMKDMRFSIDIIWINADLRVVDFAQEVHPDTFPTIFQPDEKALYVLEVPAGFIEAHRITYGDLLRP